MKRLITGIIATLTIVMATAATTIDQARIYINPGHGSWGSGDRACSTVKHGAINYDDTTNFYESNTNLQKGLALFHKLKEYGVSHNASSALDLTQNLVMSHNKCGISRGLSEIAAEAELNNFDMFISIHSNASNEGDLINYLLFLYRGTDAAEGNAGSTAMAKACWPYIIENPHQMWTHHTGEGVTNVRGDVSYMGESYTTTHTNGKSYTGYYGVLRQGVPGFLVEGYFHTYQPARHRYMNWNVCHMEGLGYARGINDYFGWGKKESTGYIYGILRDAKTTFTHAYYTPITTTLDNYHPINNATVTLKDLSGNTIAITTTDDEYNGAFVFKNIAPGNYTLTYSHPDYTELTQSVTVTANAVTYPTPQISPSTEQIARRGHFAYGLTSTLSSDGTLYTLSFKSTGALDNATITLTGKSTGKIVTLATGPITAGSNSITVDPLSLESDETFTWAVSLENSKSTATQLLYTHAAAAYYNGSYYANGGVAIDTDTDSPLYGTIYTSTGYGQGIQSINPDFTLNGSKILGSSFLTSNSSSPFRIATSNGKLYITDWSDGNAGLWVYDPTQSTASVTNVFVGTRQSTGAIINSSTTTGGGTTGVTFTGTGANRKMYVFCEDYPTGNAGNQVLRYDLGTADTWTTAPSASFSAPSALMVNTNVELLAHTNGIFCAQTRYSGSNTSGVPSFVHFTSDGTVNYNSGTTLGNIHAGSNLGAMAIYNSTMAIADVSGKINIYNLSYASTTPSLALAYSITLPATTNICQMTFDPAGNLYVHSKQEGLLVYAIKNPSRTTTTPAPAGSTLQGKSLPAVEGHFAYDLQLTTAPTTYTLSFNSTGNVDDARIILINTATQEETTIATTSLSTGLNTVTIDRDILPQDATLQWAVDIVNPQSPSSQLLATDASILYTSASLGLAIDLDTESSRYGTIYTATGQGQGLKTFTPTLTLQESQLLPSTFATGSYTCRLATSQGKVYIADVSSATGGIWLYDPAIATATASRLITQQSRSLSFTGTGADRKMYITAYNLDSNTDTRLLRYDIGSADTWTGTYTAYFDAPTSLMPNGKGDLLTTPQAIFMAQTRYAGNNTSAVPAFLVLDHSGTITFNSSALSTLTGSHGGAMALTQDLSTFAVIDSYTEGTPTSLPLRIYSITWNAATPSFTYLYTITLDGTLKVEQMEFDPAGNLLIASNEKGLLKYALKLPERTTRTQAPSVQQLSYASKTGIETIASDTSKPCRYHNLQGIEVKQPLSPGLYIETLDNGQNRLIQIK